MLRYWIRGYDGKEYGPVDLQTLSKWCLEGRVIDKTLVRREQEEWQAATYYNELSSFFTLHSAGWHPPADMRSIRAVFWALAQAWQIFGKHGANIVGVWGIVMMGTVALALLGTAGNFLVFLVSGPLFTGYCRYLQECTRSRPTIAVLSYGFGRYFPTAPNHWLRQAMMLAPVMVLYQSLGYDTETLKNLMNSGAVPDPILVQDYLPLFLGIIASALLSYTLFWWSDPALALHENIGWMTALSMTLMMWLRSPLPCLVFFVLFMSAGVFSALFLFIPIIFLWPYLTLATNCWFLAWAQSSKDHFPQQAPESF